MEPEPEVQKPTQTEREKSVMFLHPGSSATTVQALLNILNNNNKPTEDSSSSQNDSKDPAALKAAA